MYQKYIRRTEGRLAARAVFAQHLPLRKAGTLGYEVYLTHADIERHVNQEPDVASFVMMHLYL